MSTVRLVDLVLADPPLMARLRAARSLDLPSWCIGGGAVRNIVWDAIFDVGPTPPRDLDLAWLGPVPHGDLRAHDMHLEATLRALDPGAPWEVRNQARWGATSLDSALATWPEPCTAVGVWLDEHDDVNVVAPLGLGDLFAGIIRHNPARISPKDWATRQHAKRWTSRWPGTRLVS